MAAFKALYENEYESDGITIKTINRIHRWSDDYDVQNYIR